MSRLAKERLAAGGEYLANRVRTIQEALFTPGYLREHLGLLELRREGRRFSYPGYKLGWSLPEDTHGQIRWSCH